MEVVHFVLRLLMLLSLGLALAQSGSSQLPALELPGGAGGVGFDDLRYAPELQRLLVPAGQTGNLVLADPTSQELTIISVSGSGEEYQGGHGEGVTSADAGRGLLYAIDRTRQRLEVIDPATKKIVTGADLEGSPDYVRYVAPTHELWVTEPDREQVEVFTLPAAGPAPLSRQTSIAVAGGPESLIIDPTRGRAYTHQWNGQTVAIDLRTHRVLESWPNGCSGSRGIALDEGQGLLFAGCAEGKATAMDLNSGGALVASLEVGKGVDVIAYNSMLGHLYLPGAASASMAVAGVSSTGDLSLLTTVPTVEGAHCAASDDQNNVWICDPEHGRLLRWQDTVLPSR
jgi:hypothetical protein